MLNARLLFFLLSVGLMLFAGALHWISWAEAYKAPAMLISYGLLFCGCLGAWASFPDGLSTALKITLILSISLLVRICMIGVAESDDVYRYLWEGKIVAAGESPYRYPADHSVFADYRDAYWDGMNHKDKLTAYPPLAELVFAGVSSLSYTPWAFKILFIIADLCVIGILIAMLKRYALDIRTVLFYALNPLTLFAFAGEAHFDVLLIFAMLASVWLAERRKFGWAWIWLGVAIQIKIIAIVLLPLYLWRCHCQKSWIILIPLVLPSVFFIETLPGFFQGVWHFGGLNTFNGPIHAPITYMLDGCVFTATLLVIAILGFVALWVTWAIQPLVKAAFATIAALVLLLPVVHYWYILWALPFVVLFPSIAWLILSLTSGAYFVSVFSMEQGGDWMLPVWAMWVTWLPFLLLLVHELRSVFLRKLRSEIDWKKPETLAVVVPVLNEENQIQSCLNSLQTMKQPPNEIIVCDGGSSDKTVSVAKAMGARVVESAPGRGIQIGAGVEQASSDVVLIVHADCQCDESVSQRILTVLEKNPDAVGGAVGQRFLTSNARLLVIEMLNDMRAAAGGSSFGDQGQFFRVAALEKMGGYPVYPLMEDVELSLRMKQAGRVVFLGEGIQNSARQWRQAFGERVRLIIKLVMLFHWNRFLRRDVTQELYTKYYNR